MHFDVQIPIVGENPLGDWPKILKKNSVQDIAQVNRPKLRNMLWDLYFRYQGNKRMTRDLGRDPNLRYNKIASLTSLPTKDHQFWKNKGGMPSRP